MISSSSTRRMVVGGIRYRISLSDSVSYESRHYLVNSAHALPQIARLVTRIVGSSSPD
jgi:hypothetical protein